MNLPQLESAKYVALYASVHGEVETEGIISRLIAEGKAVVLPQVVGEQIYFCRIRNMSSDMSCVGTFGIREPDPACCERIDPSTVDLFLAPGVCFDLFGGRIGFGGGFYDRYLTQRNQDANVVALAYDFQILHALPGESHDIVMDGIVTENGFYRPCRSTFLSSSEEDTRKLAEVLYHRGLYAGGVAALHGQLGAGKSVFVNGMARAVEAVEETASPTFVYLREYHGKTTVYHADSYRVERISEVDAEFWNELMSKPGIIAVEWGERLGSILPKDTVHLFGRVLNENLREWTVFTAMDTQSILHGVDIC